MPSPSSTIGSDSSSYSSRISPTISSIRSSIVTRPAVPPYSSTTMALWTCLTCSSRSRSATRLLSGMTWAGLKRRGTIMAVPGTPSSVTRSLANTNPRILSRFSLNTGIREYSRSANSARNSPMVASCAMATISGRGVMTSRTRVPPKSTTDCNSRRSSDSPAVAPASSSSLSCSGSPPPSPLDEPSVRVRGGRARRRNPPLTGPTTRNAVSNDGSSSSSTRPASRRASADGTICSQTIRNRATSSSNSAAAWAVSAPVIRANTTAATANSSPRTRRVAT